MLYDALAGFQAFMDSQSASPVELVLCLVAIPLSTLAHETGHALAAWRYRIPVQVFSSGEEGPSVRVTRGRTEFRVGLGLGRDLRSKASQGHVVLDFSRATPQQAINVLRAGPAFQAVYGGLCVVGGLTFGGLPQWLMYLAGLVSVTAAASNLRSDDRGQSDGAKIRRIRAAVASTRTRPADRDAHAATSVAPPR